MLESASPAMGPDDRGVWGADAIQLARWTVLDLMQTTQRNGMVKLLAAKTVLSRDYLEHLTDDDLLAEVERRAALRSGNPPARLLPAPASIPSEFPEGDS